MSRSAELTGADVEAAAAWVVTVSRELDPDQWERPCLDEWTARRVLDHLVDTMLLYSGAIATRATETAVPVRNGDPTADPPTLHRALTHTAAILSRLIDGMHPDERAFHPSGLADSTGWAGMACTELVVHGWDMTFQPTMPEGLATRTVDRVLPWTPAGHPGSARLLWATGRAPLPSQPPAPADWWWQSAPLSEWDGRPRRRTSPPQW